MRSPIPNTLSQSIMTCWPYMAHFTNAFITRNLFLFRRKKNKHLRTHIRITQRLRVVFCCLWLLLYRSNADVPFNSHEPQSMVPSFENWVFQHSMVSIPMVPSTPSREVFPVMPHWEIQFDSAWPMPIIPSRSTRMVDQAVMPDWVFQLNPVFPMPIIPDNALVLRSVANYEDFLLKNLFDAFMLLHRPIVPAIIHRSFAHPRASFRHFYPIDTSIEKPITTIQIYGTIHKHHEDTATAAHLSHTHIRNKYT